MKFFRQSSRTRGKKNNPWKIIALGAALIALRFGSQIADWIPVAPLSPEIKQLAHATTMTPEAQQIFYRQAPTIQPKEAFLKSCEQLGKLEEGQFLLGCYISNGQSGKIVIQSISDVRFNGTMEVAAAHEMLHAAYSRLSLSERDALAPRLIKAARRVTDRRLAKVLKKYENTDSTLFVNELHSHLGAELGDLDNPELEQHYRRYFADRRRVVALSQESQAALHNLDDQSDQLKAEIDTLEASLKSTKAELKVMQQDLADRRQNMGTLRANLSQFQAQVEQTDRQDNRWPDIIAQFEEMKSHHNQQVREYNERVQQLQDQVAQFNQQVSPYKQKVRAYNDINDEKHSLLAELDSSTQVKK
jgi:uncharacterized coiled-coil DUF342 family protein